MRYLSLLWLAAWRPGTDGSNPSPSSGESDELRGSQGQREAVAPDQNRKSLIAQRGREELGRALGHPPGSIALDWAQRTAEKIGHLVIAHLVEIAIAGSDCPETDRPLGPRPFS